MQSESCVSGIDVLAIRIQQVSVGTYARAARLSCERPSNSEQNPGPVKLRDREPTPATATRFADVDGRERRPESDRKRKRRQDDRQDAGRICDAASEARKGRPRRQPPAPGAARTARVQCRRVPPDADRRGSPYGLGLGLGSGDIASAEMCVVCAQR